VELGKVLAKTIQTELSNAAEPERHDSSTNALIAKAKAALQ
jgi:glucose-6-phosphate isomerase